MPIYAILILSGALFFGTMQAVAQQPPPAEVSVEQVMQMRAELERRIAEISGDEAALAKMMEEGKFRTLLCKTCHGDDGVSVKEVTPSLAGQNPVYLVDQFQRFADGQRYDYLMSGLAKSFTQEDKIKIALYYSSLEMKSFGGGRMELLGKGEQLFKSLCVKCHGEDGRGQEGYAMLAGQRPDYVVKMLKEFRDKTGRRFNPWMSGVAVGLSDGDMEALAAYLANLR